MVNISTEVLERRRTELLATIARLEGALTEVEYWLGVASGTIDRDPAVGYLNRRVVGAPSPAIVKARNPRTIKDKS